MSASEAIRFNRRPRILALLSTYRTGNEATGPVQSLRAFALEMRDDFDIKVVGVANSRAEQLAGDNYEAAPSIKLRSGIFCPFNLRKVLNTTPHELLLLNSFHDPQLVLPTLVMRKLNLISRKPTILSPRGEFAKGAMSIKPRKKLIYRRAIRRSRLTSDIWIHATADHEIADIQSVNLPCRGVLRAPNISVLPQLPAREFFADDERLRIAFLGRISPVKNLEFAIDVLSQVSIPVTFDIFGPLVDEGYARSLGRRIQSLPGHIKVELRGPIPHDRVVPELAKHDLFFLPTLGENFGHAINEALSAGLPALIADTTPWRGLEAAGAGWDLSLSQPHLFVKAIEGMAKSRPEQRQAMRKSARRFAENSFAQSDAIEANRRMIHRVLDADASDSGNL